MFPDLKSPCISLSILQMRKLRLTDISAKGEQRFKLRSVQHQILCPQPCIYEPTTWMGIPLSPFRVQPRSALREAPSRTCTQRENLMEVWKFQN